MSQSTQNDWFVSQVLSAQKSVSEWPSQFRGKEAVASARLPAAPKATAGTVATNSVQNSIKQS